MKIEVGDRVDFEPMMTEIVSSSETELEDLENTSSAESLCEALRAQMVQLAAASEEVDTQVRRILRKVKHADVWTAETLKLTPKPHTKKWLGARGWTEPTIELGEFLSLFYSAATALDIENQSLHLEKAEADLFQVSSPVSIYALLRNLPLVFA